MHRPLHMHHIFSSATPTTPPPPFPLQVPIDYSAHWRPAPLEGLPNVFTGGWVGYTGYDTVRYVYSGGFFTFDRNAC